MDCVHIRLVCVKVIDLSKYKYDRYCIVRMEVLKMEFERRYIRNLERVFDVNSRWEFCAFLAVYVFSMANVQGED